MEEAARIAREEHGSNKIAVISGRFLYIHLVKVHHGCPKMPIAFVSLISTVWHVSLTAHQTNTFIILGVGTRNYYRKLGYELEGPYMTKRLLEE